MLSVRHPNMQDITVPATQAPAPSQSAAVVALPAVQLAAAPHEVVLLGNVQAARCAAVPSHLPAQVPVPTHAARGVVAGEQVPFALAVLHDSQFPVQVESQQTPSTQLPVPPSAPLAQVVPLVFPTQVVPFMHTGLLPVHVGQHSFMAMQLPLHIFCVPVQPGPPPAPAATVPPDPTPVPPLPRPPPEPAPTMPPLPLECPPEPAPADPPEPW